MQGLARTLALFEAGELQDSTELLRAYACVLLPFGDGNIEVDMDDRLRRFIEAGDAVYRDTLGDGTPSPQYNLVLRMLGIEVP
jgi:hypothetical protein